MASAQAWSIKKRWASKFEEFLRTSSAGHLAVSLTRGDCVYITLINFIDGVSNRLWLKCIVGQSWAKLGKVDMFSKEVIKKQSWQSWCIFLSIFKYNMQSKVGKVQIRIHYSRQSWQSWGYFYTNLASL